MNLDNIDVSVIIPVHNGAVWLGECLASVLRQQHTLTVEVSVFLDSCKDTSEDIVQGWAVKLEDQGYVITVGKENNDKPKGVGYAKNKAVEQSHGEFLFSRDPPDSTVRYTKWANGLTAEQLTLQIYTSHGPTVIMPTWFIHHTVFERVGGFSDAGAGTPEDLIFFFTHLKRGGRVVRHDEELLIYRYHPQATTFSIHEQTIWDLRVRVIQDEVLSSWPSFTIWNAGKQGRKFYRSLTTDNQKKVMAFCDVDVKKIGSFYTYEESQEKPKPRIPMIHFKEAKPPLIICMKMELTDGVFEENLASLQLKEGTDYFHFN
ncbi:UDP-GlcNAc:betaGal beta-1-3-N-acetylglucosaminyltransferase-like protein 1-like [Homarus americanus]|uniref:UDP-GlcNAc:betaGal beta-1-3-N-acetylglucosaminyltransferase-like protein 1-like n=1 Tax=Homarus americanus TaxID=6706 RepID=A0A8J5JCL6_HOMAM|nr:UDP-GlcNAc:betaGal beta-1-3-N-acetylglucosaminyltransferase-like protein 1-like [Homarus americanus]